MRILLSAGLNYNNLMQVKTRTDIVTSVLHFKQVFDYQNKHHPGKENVVSKLLYLILYIVRVIWTLSKSASLRENVVPLAENRS